MDPEEAPPPPYSAVDPLLAPSASNNRNATTSSPANHSLLQLRGGDARLHGRSGPAAAPLVGSPAQPLPAHFTSAAAYFAERPAPTDIEHGQQILEHSMTVYPRSQAKDFPRRPRCWSPRMDNIAQQDWDMFLRHLYPPSLGLASSSAELPRQVRAEIRRDRKDRPQETDDERERRIATVMKEWNQYFFEPRAVRIVFFYVTDLRSAPISPLCPRCYPAATRATQENRNAQTPEAGRGHPLPGNMYPATLGYPGQAPYPSQAPGPYGYPTHAMPSPFPPQGGTGFFHPANPHAYQNPYPQHPPWGWNNQYPQQQDSSSLKGGPLGWFSNLATKAQMYGDRISEQAWQYGDQLSYYGRQVEEQALAHGRWIEEQAGLGSRKVESAFSGWNPPQQGYYQYQYPQPQPQPPPTSQTTMPGQQTWVTGTNTQTTQATPTLTTTNTSTTATPAPQQPSRPSSQPRSIAQPPTPQPQAQEQAQQPSQPHTQSRSQPQSQSHAQTQPPALTRRASTSSTTSTSSLSSISSISTTSDLSSSDLATVRAQLLSLDAHHDRDLYDAAKELRRQLDALRDTRRQARIAQSNRTTTSTMGGRWRTGWGSSSSKGESSHLGGLGRGLGMGKSSWGRWESPQDRQRNAAERKAAKDELRATRKAFRDVLRRAREEQKERRRVKRSRRAERRVREWELQSQNQNQGQTERAEQPSVSVSISGQQPEPASLEDQLQNLELGTTRNEPGSRPTARRADTDENADAHSESSAVSLVSTPSTSSDEEGDGKKKKGKEQALNKELK